MLLPEERNALALANIVSTVHDKHLRAHMCLLGDNPMLNTDFNDVIQRCNVYDAHQTDLAALGTRILFQNEVSLTGPQVSIIWPPY